MSANQLPATGFKRASEILKYLPFSRTTLWAWSKDGRFPAPVKIGENTTCWRCEDVHAWIAKQGKALQAAAYDTEGLV